MSWPACNNNDEEDHEEHTPSNINDGALNFFILNNTEKRKYSISLWNKLKYYYLEK